MSSNRPKNGLKKHMWILEVPRLIWKDKGPKGLYKGSVGSHVSIVAFEVGELVWIQVLIGDGVLLGELIRYDEIVFVLHLFKHWNDYYYLTYYIFLNGLSFFF